MTTQNRANRLTFLLAHRCHYYEVNYLASQTNLAKSALLRMLDRSERWPSIEEIERYFSAIDATTGSGS